MHGKEAGEARHMPHASSLVWLRDREWRNKQDKRQDHKDLDALAGLESV